ncbi:MAG: hypothetical protein E6Q97_38550 [Desulfurellales bacterium]|nr:MAG: hypothetical protein E6Q97_38550 [Desulfurellales bacterium]
MKQQASCPECDGTGTIETFQAQWDPRIGHYTEHDDDDCPLCSGDGTVSAAQEALYLAEQELALTTRHLDAQIRAFCAASAEVARREQWRVEETLGALEILQDRVADLSAQVDAVDVQEAA